MCKIGGVKKLEVRPPIQGFNRDLLDVVYFVVFYAVLGVCFVY